MSTFQVVALAVLLTLLAVSVAAWWRGWIGRREGLLWSAVWLLAAIAMTWPNAMSRIARMVGIGRGADLVLYSAVIALSVGLWMMYLRLRRVRREMTLLVRHLAILEAEREPGERGN